MKRPKPPFPHEEKKEKPTRFSQRLVAKEMKVSRLKRYGEISIVGNLVTTATCVLCIL